jgi:hypothetical protein
MRILGSRFSLAEYWQPCLETLEWKLQPKGVFPQGRPDMRKKLTIFLAAVTAFFVISPAMFGHHGVSDYDMANVVTWHGTVTGFLFVNPHSLLDFTRKNDQGKVEEWQGELQSPSMLARRGHWTKDTVKAGDEITIVGCPARNGSKTMFLRKVVLANGEEYPGG